MSDGCGFACQFYQGRLHRCFLSVVAGVEPHGTHAYVCNGATLGNRRPDVDTVVIFKFITEPTADVVQFVFAMEFVPPPLPQAHAPP
jgi:hypothetical protein